MNARPKYIFENGVMKLNPQYAPQSGQQQPLPGPQPLAIVSSTQDIAQATQAQIQATGKPMQLSEATVASMQIMQDGEFLNKFRSQQPLSSGHVLDNVSNIFAQYEVPIGLLNKLLVLSEYKLNFIMDDSGSMTLRSDALVAQASPHMKQKCDLRRNSSYSSDNTFMTRWEEAEDRLHVMIDMLAYIPTNTIRIGFLNRDNVIELNRNGKTPEQFASDAHQQISQAFNRLPNLGTPIYSVLSKAFSQCNASTMHYLFTDGLPNDATVDKVKELVLKRPNPQMNPLTFMSCSNDESEVKWMKDIEQDAPYTAELDNFVAERKEVIAQQGPGFPFSKGFWLLCQLVAAINPYDLDAMDEPIPFTKMTMDNLMGRKLTAQEYQFYFRSNPNSQKYSHLYDQFAREDIMAHQIVKGNTSANQQNQYHSGSSMGFFNAPQQPSTQQGNYTSNNSNNYQSWRP